MSPSDEPQRNFDIDALNQRIVQLEEASAHQERFLAQLNEVILNLRTSVDATRRIQEQLTAQVRTLRDTSAEEPRDPVDEKPPHY